MQKNRYLWQLMPVDSLRIDVQMNLSLMACCRATPYYIIIGSADSLAVAEKLLYVMPEGCRADMLWLVNMRVSGPFSVFLM